MPDFKLTHYRREPSYLDAIARAEEEAIKETLRTLGWDPDAESTNRPVVRDARLNSAVKFYVQSSRRVSVADIFTGGSRGR